MVAVCVPWRPGDPHRNANWNHVRTFWSDYPVFVGDTDGPFNRAAARNKAAAQTDADILIFGDADTVGDHQAIREAVDHASETGELTYPHTRTVKLSKTGTAQLKAGQSVKGGQRLEGSPAGILVVRRDLYEQVLWDERFDAGWGYEDVAFAMAARTLGGVHRIEANIIHLWHPVAAEKRDAIGYKTGNRALRDEYGRADGNPKSMRRLLEELRCCSASRPPLPAPGSTSG